MLRFRVIRVQGFGFRYNRPAYHDYILCIAVRNQQLPSQVEAAIMRFATHLGPPEVEDVAKLTTSSGLLRMLRLTITMLHSSEKKKLKSGSKIQTG